MNLLSSGNLTFFDLKLTTTKNNFTMLQMEEFEEKTLFSKKFEEEEKLF